MRKYPVLLICLVIVLIILIPIGIDHLIIGNGIYSNISNSDWVSFLGSYIGSLIGAGVSVVGIFMTIKFSEKQSKNDREFMIEMNREERRLSISPLLICQTDNNIHKFDSSFISSLDGEKSNTPFNVLIVITNVGIGDAVDFELSFISYNEEDMRQSLVSNYFKKDTSMRVLVDLSIYLLEMPEDIDDHLEKQPEGRLLEYAVPEKYNHRGGNIKMEIKYKDLIGNAYSQEMNLSIRTGFQRITGVDKHWVHSHPSVMLTAQKARYVKN